MSKIHLEEVAKFWSELLQKEDLAIDATCGNGFDTLKLSRLAKQVVALDIQEQAIIAAKQIATSDNIRWMQQSHASFPDWITPNTVTLIAYNLGYLPGGNKQITTKTDSTMTSIQNGLALLKKGGAITIVCYPGHAEGEKEEEQLLEFSKKLSNKEYLVSHTRWLNRPKHPSLIKLIKL